MRVGRLGGSSKSDIDAFYNSGIQRYWHAICHPTSQKKVLQTAR